MIFLFLAKTHVFLAACSWEWGRVWWPHSLVYRPPSNPLCSASYLIPDLWSEASALSSPENKPPISCRGERSAWCLGAWDGCRVGLGWRGWEIGRSNCSLYRVSQVHGAPHPGFVGPGLFLWWQDQVVCFPSVRLLCRRKDFTYCIPLGQSPPIGLFLASKTCGNESSTLSYFATLLVLLITAFWFL